MKPAILRTKGAAGIATLILPSRSEHCITVSGKDDVTLNRIFRDAAEERKAVILDRFVFADFGYNETFHRQVTASDGRIVWLQGGACRDGASVSMQAFAVSGTHPLPVEFNGRDLGFVYEDDDARYCRLSGVRPEKSNASRPEQAREVFAILKAALKENGFLFADTVRTWFYLDGILAWYNEFNAVRTAFFEEHGVFGKRIPASTGIGAGNAFGTALIADLLAIQPKTSRVTIQSVPSPMQGPALDYRSAFSRAVELTFPTHRSLLISGTASIDPDGKSAHAGSPVLQMDLTMRAVEALLRSCHMDWNDLFRGIAYFKNMEDRKLFDVYCRTHHIPAFLFAVAHADICRSDLLFEIDVDTVQAADGKNFG